MGPIGISRLSGSLTIISGGSSAGFGGSISSSSAGLEMISSSAADAFESIFGSAAAAAAAACSSTIPVHSPHSWGLSCGSSDVFFLCMFIFFFDSFRLAIIFTKASIVELSRSSLLFVAPLFSFDMLSFFFVCSGGFFFFFLFLAAL